jgi:hypothetical protein
MSAPITARFGKFRVMLGAGDSPIVYSAPCGFTSKSMTLTKNLSDVSLPDCDDPDAPIWLGRDVRSCSVSIGGQGVAAADALPVWIAAFQSTDSIPIKIEIEYSSGTLTGTGLAHIETLEFGAEQGGRVTLNPSLQSDGEIVFTDTFS